MSSLALLWILLLPANPASYRADITASLDPSQPPGVIIEVPVKITNTGSVPWKTNEFNLSYHWYGSEGKVRVWDGKRTPLENAVLPGQTITVQALVKLPVGTGDHYLEWDLVRESSFWMSDIHPGYSKRLPVTLKKITFNVLEDNTPTFIIPSVHTSTRVTVENTGDDSWIPGENFFLSYHWLSSEGKRAEWNGERTVFPDRVDPGDKITLDVHLITPEKSGRYRLCWDMVQEHRFWVSDLDGRILDHYTGVTVISLMDLSVLVLLILLVTGTIIRIIRGRGALLIWLPAAWFITSIVWKTAYTQSRLGLLYTWDIGALALLFGLCTMMFAALLPGKFLVRFSLALNILLTAIMFSDLVYFRYFSDLPSLFALAEIGQIPQLGASISTLISWEDARLLIDIVWIFCLTIGLRPVQSSSRFYQRIATLVLLLLSGFLLYGLSTHITRANEDIFNKRFRNIFIVEASGVTGYHAFDTYDFVHNLFTQHSLSPGRLQEIQALLDHSRATITEKLPTLGSARGKNIIVIQEESLQDFVVDMVIEGQEITPFINELKSRSYYFENFYDQTSQGRTSDAELAVLNGCYPMTGASINFYYTRNEFHGLPHILADRGYYSLYAHPHQGAFWNRRVMMKRYGFSETRFKESFDITEIIGWGLSNRQFFAQMIPVLKKLDQPYFAYLVTLTGHHPFHELPPFEEQLSLPDSMDPVIRDYLQVCRYKDDCLREFVDKLKEEGLWDNSLLVFFGDHDAGIFCNEFYRMMGVEHNTLERRLLDKVPCLIHCPDGQPGERISRATGHLNVGPTILHLLGSESENLFFFGTNALSEDDNPVIWRDGSATDGTRMLLLRQPYSKSTCYDMKRTGKMPCDNCNDLYRMAARELDASDDFIRGDGIRDLLEADQGTQPAD